MAKRALICSIGFYPEYILEGLAPETAKAYIITEAVNDRCADQVQTAKGLLEAKGIPVEIVKCNIFHPDDCFRQLDELFHRLGKTYAIDVNVGLGSPVLSVMGYTIAAIQGQRAYCVKWPLETETGSHPRIEFEPLPQLPLEVFDDVLVCLNYIGRECESDDRGLQRRKLASYLKRNCRPRIEGDDDKGSAHQKGARIRQLVEKMVALRYISASPSEKGTEYERLHLDPLGERVRFLFGHRVPATGVNLCLDKAPSRSKAKRQ